jgi:2-amino-4-hydroxy-6-hydroxymethyldihydropteridine diphosphokinase
MVGVLVALGSNQGASVRVLSGSLRRVAAACDARVLGCSRLFRSPAELVEAQPDFYSAVLLLEVPAALAEQPRELLRRLKGDEAGFAKSAQRFGPRELDLDVIEFLDGREVRLAGEGGAEDAPRAAQRCPSRASGACFEKAGRGPAGAGDTLKLNITLMLKMAS